MHGGLRLQGYVDCPTTWNDPLGLIKCKESVKPARSYEDARNQALQDIEKRGGIDPATRHPLIAKDFHGQNPGAGQVTGFRASTPGGEPVTYRLDYDPEKGPHINVQIGKGSGMVNNAYTFPGTQQDYMGLLRQFQR